MADTQIIGDKVSDLTLTDVIVGNKTHKPISQEPTEWDAQGNPVQASGGAVGEWDAAGNPVGPSTAQKSPTAASAPPLAPAHDPIDFDKLGMSMMWSQATGMPAAFAYEHHDQINEEFAKHGVDVPTNTNTLSNDFVNGLKGTILAESFRNKLPTSNCRRWRV